MEFVNMLYVAVKIIVGFSAFLGVLFCLYKILSPYLDKAVEVSFDKIKKQKPNDSFLTVLYGKSKKSYVMQVLLAAILCASYFFISSSLISLQLFKEEWNFIVFKIARLLFFSYFLTVAYSYCLLAWHELLTHGKGGNTTFLCRYREITRKVYPATILVALFLLIRIHIFQTGGGGYFNHYGYFLISKKYMISRYIWLYPMRQLFVFLLEILMPFLMAYQFLLELFVISFILICLLL